MRGYLINKKSLLGFAGIILILLLGFGCRSFAFWLPHWKGDQSQYVALAMKLNETKGLESYNLREVDVHTASLSGMPDFKLVFPSYASGQIGKMMQSYYHYDLSYYDMIFWYKAPLFPYILKWSHNLFAGKNKPFAIVNSNLGSDVLKVRPLAAFQAQFWAAIIPVFFSLMTGLIIYLFSRNLTGVSGALFSSALFTFHSVAVFCSYRLWTEDVQTAFLWLGIYLYWITIHKSQPAIAILSGLSFGLSVLANQKTLAFLPGVFAYSLLSHEKFSLFKPLSWIRAAFRIEFILLSLTVLILTSLWFYEMQYYYGDILWQPDFKAIRSEHALKWVELLHTRPHSFIVYVLGGIYMSPFNAIGYASVVLVPFQMIRLSMKKIQESAIAYFWLMAGPLCYIMMFKAFRSAEHRYMLPVLPVICIASAMGIDKTIRYLSSKTGWRSVWIALFAVLIGISCVRQVFIALDIVFDDAVLMMVPF